MKKIVLFSLAAASVLVACTKNELVTVDNGNDEIVFDAAISKVAPKSLINGTAYPTDHTFGTVAYMTNTSGTKLYIPVSEVSYSTSGSYWSTATPYYWPKNGKLTFYSYSPYNYQSGDKSTGAINPTASETGLVFKNYNVKDNQHTDLMVADVQKDLTANNATIGSWKTGVKTVFHHKLAQIVGVNFKTTEDGTTVKDFANGHDGSTGKAFVAGDKVFIINTVQFKNFFVHGTLTANGTTAGDVWSEHGTSGNQTWHTNSAKTPLTDGIYNTTCDENGYLLVIPQTMAISGDDRQSLNVNYTVRTYTDATNYAEETVDAEAYLSSLGNWEQNKKYTYTVWINLKDQRIYWAPSVVDWESTSSASTTI